MASEPASALTNQTPPTLTGSAFVGQIISTSSGTWDEASTGVSYGWLRCNASVSDQRRIGGPGGNPAGCASISGANSSSYTLVSADLGKYISSVVIYQSLSSTVDWISASTSAVGAAPASVTSPTVSTSGLVDGQTNPNPITVSMTVNTNSVSDAVSIGIPTGWTWVNPVASGGSCTNTMPLDSISGFTYTFCRTSNPPLKEMYLRNQTAGTLAAGTVVTAVISAGALNVGAGTDFKLSFMYGSSVNDQSTVSVSLAQNSTPVQTNREVTRIPDPPLQAPILNSIAPKLTSGFSSNGGKLILKDVKPTDITSVVLNGKKLEVVTSKSGAALRIPAGAGAGDLQFTMADGTVINVANAVRITQSQVDPKLVDLNPLPTFKAGSVAVPSSIKAALKKNSAVILDSTNAQCVGYASSNTASARATALTRAANVCGIITEMNENIDPIVKVLVNKTVSKKTPVKYQTW